VKIIKTAIATMLVCSMVGLPTVQAFAQDDRRRDPQEDRRHDRDDRDRRDHDRRQWRRYDYNRHEPGQNHYDAARYYRDYREDDRSYRERRLGRNDRIYRGSDDRYYCRRSDGTTGLIVGGIAGGALGNVIAPDDSKTLGTILGAAGGAILGRGIDRNNITCR
jgi:Ni/Co efflux regulator RcnB